MQKVKEFLLSILNDVDLFKTPLLTRKQYAVSILKISVFAFVFIVFTALYIAFDSVLIFLLTIILYLTISSLLFIYFNILLIKRFLDTSIPLFLLIIIILLYILAYSLNLIYDFVIWESPIKRLFSVGIWLLPALLLFMLSFIMPSTNKARPIITKIKNSIYIKKNILYPVNNILTFKFQRRINSKQFLYGLLFIFMPLLLVILENEIFGVLDLIYSKIFDFKSFYIEAYKIEEYRNKNYGPLIPVFVRFSSVSFVFISFLVLFINSYKNAVRYKAGIFVTGLILLFILPYSNYQFFGDILRTYLGRFNTGSIGFIFYSKEPYDIYLLLSSIILLFIYYKLISVKNNLKTPQTNRIAFQEYIIKVTALICIYIVLKDILDYIEYDINSIIPNHELSLYFTIYIFIQTLFIYCMLYYTIKRVNNAIINKLIIISFIIYVLLPYYIDFMSVYILIYILLLIITGAYIPKYVSERKYTFNNEKYRAFADFFNISNKIENILFFKLKRVISIREFILSFIFTLIMYIYIIPFDWLKYMLTNMTIYLPTEVPSDNGYTTVYFIPEILYIYMILVVYSIFVLSCNAIYTIYMKRKGGINE